MLYLRPYKKDDAKTIISWCEDEITFRKWTSDRYDSYPISEEDMNYKYFDCNGDCDEKDNFYPMTACDETGIVGHFIMRYISGHRDILRIGFVIIDDKKRGHGYGKRMIQLAIDYAFKIAGAEQITIGVFENNLPAYNCYKAAGFHDVKSDQEEICELFGEKWRILELEINRNEFEKMTYELQPLRLQGGWKIEFNNFTEYDMSIHGEMDSLELSEDLLRLSNDKANMIIDLGWYPSFDTEGEYILELIKNYNWDQPLEKVCTQSKSEIISNIEKWVCYGFYSKYLNK